MEQPNGASPKPLADAVDFEEFESLSQEQAAPAQQPQAEEKPTKTSVPKGEKPAGEIAAVPETAQSQEQKQQQPRPIERKRDAESTIHKKDREIADLRKELEDYRKNAATPQVAQPAPESPKPASQPATLPKLSEYVKAEHAKRPDVLQEDLIEEWVSKRDEQAEQSRQAKAAQERFQQTLRDVKAKRPDVDPDEVFGTADGRKPGIVLGSREVNVMGALMANLPNWHEVLYYLHDHPDEYSSLRSQSPQEQWFDVVAIARQLARGAPPFSQAQAPAEVPAAQEQPRNVRPISRVPAPAKHTLGGGMPPEAKSMREARDFEEAEALEKRRLAGGR